MSSPEKQTCPCGHAWNDHNAAGCMIDNGYRYCPCKNTGHVPEENNGMANVPQDTESKIAVPEASAAKGRCKTCNGAIGQWPVEGGCVCGLVPPVASEAKDTLSEELRELSGWEQPYSLGGILRKLQRLVEADSVRNPHTARFSLTIVATKDWTRYVCDLNYDVAPYSDEADNPEDAVIKLAIELFKQGILAIGDSNE